MSKNVIKHANFRGGFKWARGGRTPSIPPPPYFLQSLSFSNHFEELQAKLFEDELIIKNARLIYVYPNTIKTCLTPNYLLFGR